MDYVDGIDEAMYMYNREIFRQREFEEIRKRYVRKYVVISRDRGKTLRDSLELYDKYLINDIHLDGTGKIIAQLRTHQNFANCGHVMNRRVFVNLELLEISTE